MYEDNLALTEQAPTPELYIITSGSYSWHYTNYTADLPFNHEVYKAATIKRSSFSSSRSMEASRMTIQMPVTPPVTSYLSSQPAPSTTIQVYSAVLPDLVDYSLLFNGRVTNISVKDNVITLDCSMNNELSVRLPNIIYQSFCNWSVFDSNCGLNEADWDVAALAQIGSYTMTYGGGDASNFGSIATFTLDGGGTALYCIGISAYGANYFAQGRVKYKWEYRLVVGQSGDWLALQFPFSSELVNNSLVTLYPGCDGQASTCRTKFNNFTRKHVSMPYIPSHNPAVWGFK